LQDRLNVWFDKEPTLTFMERIRYLIESENLYVHEPYAIRYGHTFGYILDRISIVIQPDELIVGRVKEEVPVEPEATGYANMFKKWWDIPDREKQKKILWFYSDGWLKCRPPWFYTFGHLALDWQRLITEGLQSFRDQAENRLQDPNLETSQQEFLQGVILCYEAISRFIGRYALEAKRLGLSDLASSLEHLATGAARTFQESLQLIWLIVLPLEKVAGCGVLNLDRMDQYLYPFYAADREHANVSDSEMLAILEDFYFKNNEIMAPLDHMSQETDLVRSVLEVTYDDPNYLTIGGLKPDGTSGVNRLSHLMVTAAHRLKLRNPFIVVRWHENIDDDFWLCVIAAMRDNATLVVYNDETMIPALKKYGVEFPEVYNYGFFGCNDPNIGAYEGGLRQFWFNLARSLDLALHEGNCVHVSDNLKPDSDHSVQVHGNIPYTIRDRMTGLVEGPYSGLKTDDLSQITSMERFVEQFRKQVFYQVQSYRYHIEKDMQLEKSVNKGRLRIEDCFIKGTVESAQTWNDGGTKYHKIVAQGTGLATVVDSLAAIDQLVFTEKAMTFSEFGELLTENFAGSERLAERLSRRFPKFGNDHEKVDYYAQVVTNIYCDAIESVNGPQYLYQLWPTLSSDRDFTTMGLDVAATPDGRRAGAPLSENQSPNEGCDRNGLTAMLNSLAKVPFNRITGGPLNVRIHPSACSGDDGLQALADLFATYLNKGGMQVQINVVDSEQLKDAQIHPDKYRNLCVRVTGYSAYFIQMGKKAQDELIHRTEQVG
jgi:formate C-acetyltransferase